MTIQANEIRIGNWVADRANKCPLFVREVQHNGISYDCKHVVYDFIEYDKIEGIRLSKEILESLGFASSRPGSGVLKLVIAYEDSEYPCSLQQTGDGIQICRSGIGAITSHIQHLHQLQNLYFALTGTELNYQP